MYRSGILKSRLPPPPHFQNAMMGSSSGLIGFQGCARPHRVSPEGVLITTLWLPSAASHRSTTSVLVGRIIPLKRLSSTPIRGRQFWGMGWGTNTPSWRLSSFLIDGHLNRLAESSRRAVVVLTTGSPGLLSMVIGSGGAGFSTGGGVCSGARFCAGGNSFFSKTGSSFRGAIRDTETNRDAAVSAGDGCLSGTSNSKECSRTAKPNQRPSRRLSRVLAETVAGSIPLLCQPGINILLTVSLYNRRLPNYIFIQGKRI
jgi:hypothetical protein